MHSINSSSSPSNPAGIRPRIHPNRSSAHNAHWMNMLKFLRGSGQPSPGKRQPPIKQPPEKQPELFAFRKVSFAATASVAFVCVFSSVFIFVGWYRVRCSVVAVVGSAQIRRPPCACAIRVACFHTQHTRTRNARSSYDDDVTHIKWVLLRLLPAHTHTRPHVPKVVNRIRYISHAVRSDLRLMMSLFERLSLLSAVAPWVMCVDSRRRASVDIACDFYWIGPGGMFSHSTTDNTEQWNQSACAGTTTHCHRSRCDNRVDATHAAASTQDGGGHVWPKMFDCNYCDIFGYHQNNCLVDLLFPVFEGIILLTCTKNNKNDNMLAKYRSEAQGYDLLNDNLF